MKRLHITTPMIFLLLSCYLNLLNASGTWILSKTSKIYLNNKEIGYVTVLTPVKKISSQKIKVKGFRLENYPQLIVRDMRRGEIYIEFNEENENEALTLFKPINSFEDEYGEIWQEVEGIVEIEKSSLTDDINSLYKKAKTTYEQTCSMCHHLPEPHAYTVNQWPQQIESMMEQIPLDSSTKALITKYLQQHAADTK